MQKQSEQHPMHNLLEASPPSLTSSACLRIGIRNPQQLGRMNQGEEEMMMFTKMTQQGTHEMPSKHPSVLGDSDNSVVRLLCRREQVPFLAAGQRC
jgi:hypothetical protein